MTTGFSLGVGLVIVGFEFEYGHARENLEELAPSLRTYMFNGLLQTPVPIAGIQFYGTAGAGAYHETLNEISETNVGINLGGGVKVNLAGPLRLRLDYRIFTLQGSPRHSKPQRFYAGAESEVLSRESLTTGQRVSGGKPPSETTSREVSSADSRRLRGEPGCPTYLTGVRFSLL